MILDPDTGEFVAKAPQGTTVNEVTDGDGLVERSVVTSAGATVAEWQREDGADA